MLEQVVQLAGAVLILLAFIAAQTGRVGQRSHGYLGLNALGSAALAADALHSRQWGFLLLEGTWAAISVAGLAVRRKPSPATSPRTGRAGLGEVSTVPDDAGMAQRLPGGLDPGVRAQLGEDVGDGSFTSAKSIGQVPVAGRGGIEIGNQAPWSHPISPSPAPVEQTVYIWTRLSAQRGPLGANKLAR
jgi:hypothetical protein